MNGAKWCGYTPYSCNQNFIKLKEDRVKALKRHLEFFNTQPSWPTQSLGVTFALEEERANGAEIDDAAISGLRSV